MSEAAEKTGYPSGWVLIPLGELAAPQPGAFVDGPFGSKLKTAHYTDSGPRVIRLQNVGDGLFQEAEAHISKEHFETLRRHEAVAGDVVIATLGDDLPRACKVPEWLGPAIVKADCPRLRIDRTLATPDFVVYALNTEATRKRAAKLVHGVGRQRLNLRSLKKLSTPLAPLPEQRRIVSTVDSYFSRLDAAEQALERVQANLERYRASILKAAVEGRLVPTEAELAREEGRDYEPAEKLLERILVERRKRWEKDELAKMRAKGKEPKSDKWKTKYKEPEGPNTEELPELSEGWCWATVDQLISHLTSGSRDWSKYYDQGSSVFIMAQNIRPGFLDLSFQKTVGPPADDPSRSRSQVEPNDLLVTIVGANTGQACRVPRPLPEHYVCQSVALMRPVWEETSQYINLFLNSPLGTSTFENFMYGQGRPHLSFKQLRATPVPIPPVKEQERIVGTVEIVNTRQTATLQTISVERCRLDRMRQSLLKWAFEGKLVDQDPDDEPASELLARIRAERQQAKKKAKPS